MSSLLRVNSTRSVLGLDRARLALSGHGGNTAAVVRPVFGPSIPLGMLQFCKAPLPGAGRGVPDLITGMGDWLQLLIVADAAAPRSSSLASRSPPDGSSSAAEGYLRCMHDQQRGFHAEAVWKDAGRVSREAVLRVEMELKTALREIGAAGYDRG